MHVFNVLTGPTEADPTDPPGYGARMARFGPSIGASLLGGSVYDLPPGQAHCPYHYEHGDEEWVIVLGGRPSVRDPDGEAQLAPGDTVCFAPGPAGAHQVVNHSDEDARVLMVSTRNLPSVAVFPDSDKISVATRDGRDDIHARRRDGVDYWDGEVGPGEG